MQKALPARQKVDWFRSQVLVNTSTWSLIERSVNHRQCRGLTTDSSTDYAHEPPGSPSRYAARYYVLPGRQKCTARCGLARSPLRTAHLQHKGSFVSSSQLLTRLRKIGASTWQLCTLDGIMDCPTREQNQWIGDGEIELLVNSGADGSTDIARKFFLDAAGDQRPDGAFPAISAGGDNDALVIDDYVFSFVNALHDYYM
jgi:hypothetical protein